MPQHTIKTSSGSELIIDEDATLNDVESGEPLFFKTPHGKRETYTMYRGFMIVRNSVKFTGQRQSTRRTIVYLFTKKMETKPGTLCVSAGHSLSGIPAARRLIDTIIERQSYEFGMEF